MRSFNLALINKAAPAQSFRFDLQTNSWKRHKAAVVMAFELANSLLPIREVVEVIVLSVGKQTGSFFLDRAY